ncbi:Protein of unknown function [Corynebacterium appendicis CIP 107643]|uniref:DUF2613 domain-containing protein n=1 Tax=Corynebacterium appendicis CIP 107643 TaxID=1161099 RepID=A0A1N7JII0_9CORY|nr:DUF2613 domain-containing protein [Corynebacterium appendicis]MCT1683989.1 DUF2613 domain-containing protein [Corynebacterium appendicis]WJY61975.1 hypothetical protein CAPP_10440 [Corynebacterium appendicis CIP 107643]SIS49118.1 Protein of unknown function [Corynebacterium appendicis CIP 107643]
MTSVIRSARSSQSWSRRTLGPVLASSVTGIVLGVIGVVGIASFSGQNQVPSGNAVPADEAVLGGPEYGSRQ